ncbi:hypothetical protein [Wolbachia endosymbiont of Pentidionis agamae]|uniref:hypothetical protein n=1 Tax=Wolbachia endosymbiont of Pentidionis agamae TaxID=3110435 RepID=UPI002FD58451
MSDKNSENDLSSMEKVGIVLISSAILGSLYVGLLNVLSPIVAGGIIGCIPAVMVISLLFYAFWYDIQESKKSEPKYIIECRDKNGKLKTKDRIELAIFFPVVLIICTAIGCVLPMIANSISSGIMLVREYQFLVGGIIGVLSIVALYGIFKIAESLDKSFNKRSISDQNSQKQNADDSKNLNSEAPDPIAEYSTHPFVSIGMNLFKDSETPASGKFEESKVECLEMGDAAYSRL